MLAKERAHLSPHVAGPVTWVAPDLIPGGRFEEGDLLLRVDPAEFRLAVEARRGDVSRAKFSALRETNRAHVKSKAWDLYRERRARAGSEADEVDVGEPHALALNIPQLADAQQALDAAQSRLEQAELRLARTRLTAPFDAVVASESVDEGQRVSPTSTVVELVGTASYFIRATVDVTDLSWLDIPGVRGSEEGSDVSIEFRGEHGDEARRRGRIVRLESGVDPEGSMAQVLVEVEDPLGLETDEDVGPPLLLGGLVNVCIEGREVEEMFHVPASAVHRGNHVWLVDENERLEMRPIEVVHRQDEVALVRSGLRSGERLVTSTIETPTEGMRLVP